MICEKGIILIGKISDEQVRLHSPDLILPGQGAGNVTVELFADNETCSYSKQKDAGNDEGLKGPAEKKRNGGGLVVSFL